MPIILAANTPSQPSPAQQMNAMWVTRTKGAAENEMHLVLTFRCGTVSTVPAVTVLYCTVLYCTVSAVTAVPKV